MERSFINPINPNDDILLAYCLNQWHSVGNNLNSADASAEALLMHGEQLAQMGCNFL